MRQSIETMSAPVLRQSVRFGERYVSSALNRKLAGILSPGVYRGFVVKPGGAGKVLVTHEDGSSRSVAVVERDGYSLTVTMDDPGYVEIPASGTWHIVIEAFYVETQPGYQRIVARENVEEHHILLATVSVEDVTAQVEEDMIDVSGCAYSETRELTDRLAGLYGLFVDQSALFAKVSTRVTRLELAQGDSPGGGMLSPEGYALGEATVAPLSVVPKGAPIPEKAAVVLEVESGGEGQ